jgi:hypothetical protein
MNTKLYELAEMRETAFIHDANKNIKMQKGEAMNVLMLKLPINSC